MQMTTLLNGPDGGPDEIALIQAQPIAVQSTKELRRIIGIHPSCKLLRAVLSLDLYTRTVVYLFLIKGWSPRRIADRLKVPPSTIQKLLETGREQLKRKLEAIGGNSLIHSKRTRPSNVA
jgi:DNA-directed RNA polymerase specialized sigma24 family protein